MKQLRTLLFHDVFRRTPAESGFLQSGAEHYKIQLADFERQLAILADTLIRPPLLATGSDMNMADADSVAITFDDGGVSYHSLVSERLESFGWRGHCLVTTAWIGKPGFLDNHHLRDLHRRGHVIGSHSVSHPVRFSQCTPRQMFREWRDSRSALQDILGADVTVASVPGGYFSAEVAYAAACAGLKILFTSEPESGFRKIHNCLVFGRFTIRLGCRAEYPSQLAGGYIPAVCREWISWNAKKPVKALLGEGYPQIAGWLASARRQHVQD